MMATTVTVKKGDTLTAIAKKAGISLDALIKLNPQIKNPNLINPGQVITITKPTPAAPVAAPAGGTDSQNAARLAAQAKTVVPVAATPVVTGTGAVTAKPTVTTIPVTPPVVEDVPVNVDFANLPADQQAALGALGENAVVPTVTAPAGKTVKSKTPKYDITGKLLGYDILYSDGSSTFESGPSSEVKKYTWKNPTTGQLESFDTAEEMQAAVDTWKVQSGQESTNAATERAATTARAEALAGRTSAFDLLRDQFDQWGMGDLVEPIRALIQDENVSPSEYAIRLRQTTPYQTRFKANAERVKNGLAAITEAEYLQLEDQYQNIMRNYGLPESYYVRGKYGVQEGFQKFIANDVSATELEDRIMTAQQRVINSNPEVLASLKAFYPDITNGDILAYTLDPKNALDNIKRKVTAAEIGGAATQAGLKTGMTRAEELAAAGITKAQAQQGFETVAGGAPRGGQLASMYGENPYTQTTAEQEVFGLAGKTEAATQRKKLTGLEKATFGGQSGATSTALVRDRAGAY